ncbi:MAG: AAA family ATPase, partial [Proteobacteria bacterium]|nr:AAA family ATPase [Pseudomonadota bacterium]
MDQGSAGTGQAHADQETDWERGCLMRIDELRLIAFGPFTGTTLDLSQGREGFHIIYGPNEAGKSSSLRALRYV